jgi:hypothetical protein
LFEEYARAVLDLNPEAMPMPRVPNPFSPFLEKEAQSKLEALEMKHNRIQHMVDMLHGELQKVDKRLATLRKKEQETGKG